MPDRFREIRALARLTALSGQMGLKLGFHLAQRLIEIDDPPVLKVVSTCVKGSSDIVGQLFA